MGMFENEYINPTEEGAGVRALDMILARIDGQGRSFDPEKAIDAAIRRLTPMREELRNGWNSPFSRAQTAMLLDLIEQFHIVLAMDRIETKLKQSSFFKLVEGKIEKATRGSAAFDLFATDDFLVGDIPRPIPTGVKTEFSSNLVAIIKERSGLAVKGLEVKAGVIDSDYRDEWKVVMRYPGDAHPGQFKTEPNYQIRGGDKIAQVILVELPIVNLIGEGIVIKNEVRGGGFGSTGK